MAGDRFDGSRDLCGEAASGGKSLGSDLALSILDIFEANIHFGGNFHDPPLMFRDKPLILQLDPDE